MLHTGVAPKVVDESLVADKRNRQERTFFAPPYFKLENARLFFVVLPMTIFTMFGEVDCELGDIIVSWSGGCWVMANPDSIIVRNMESE